MVQKMYFFDDCHGMAYTKLLRDKEVINLNKFLDAFPTGPNSLHYDFSKNGKVICAHNYFTWFFLLEVVNKGYIFKN